MHTSLLLSQVSGKVGGGFNVGVASGSVEVSIDVLNNMASSSSVFGSKLTTLSIGTKEIPLPITLELEPIYTALEKIHWKNLPKGKSYKSLSISQKKANLEMAFENYPDEVGRILSGKNII